MYSSSLELYFFVCIALLTANKFVYPEAPSYGIPCSEFIGPQYRCVSRSSCPLKYSDQILPPPTCGPEGMGVCCPIISKRSPPRCGIRQYHKVQKNPFQNAKRVSRSNQKTTTNLNHIEKIRIKQYRIFAEDKHIRSKSVVGTIRTDFEANLEVHSNDRSKSFQLQNKALREASVDVWNPKNSLRKDQTMDQYQANSQNMNQVIKPHYIKQTNLTFTPINNRNWYQKRPADESWRTLNRNFGNFLLPNKVFQETIPHTLISFEAMYQKLVPARRKFADLEALRQNELTVNAWNRNQMHIPKMHIPSLDLKLWKDNYSSYINHLRYPNMNYKWDPFNNVRYFKEYQNLEQLNRINQRVSRYPRFSDTLNYFQPNIDSRKKILETSSSFEAMNQKPVMARNAYKLADLETPSQSKLTMNAWNRNQLKHMVHIPNLHVNESYSSYINHLRYPYINYKWNPFNNMKYFKECKNLEKFYKMNQRFPLYPRFNESPHYENNFYLMNGRFSNYPRLDDKLHYPQQWKQNIHEREHNYAMHQYETQKAKFIDTALHQYKNDKNCHLPYRLPSSNDPVQESQYTRDRMKSLGLFEDKRQVFQPVIARPFRNYRSNNFLGKRRIKRHVISSHVSPKEIGYQTSNQSITRELAFRNENLGISNQTQITKELNVSSWEDISFNITDKNNANRKTLKRDMLLKSADRYIKKDTHSSFLLKREKRIDDKIQYVVYHIKVKPREHEANNVKRLPEKSPEETHYHISSEKNYNRLNKNSKTKDQTSFHPGSTYFKNHQNNYIRKINNGTLFGTDSATPDKRLTTMDQAFENKKAKITKSIMNNQLNELQNGSSDGEKAGIKNEIKFLNREMFPEMVHADFMPQTSYQKQIISDQGKEDFDPENQLKGEILLEPLHPIWSPNKRKRSSNKNASSNGSKDNSNADENSPQEMDFMEEHRHNSNTSTKIETKINSSDEDEYSRVHYSVKPMNKITERRLEYSNITEAMHYLNSVASEFNIINKSDLYIDAIEGQNTEYLSRLSIFTNNDNNLMNTESINISDSKDVDAINSNHMNSGSLDIADGGQENRELLFNGYRKNTSYSSISGLNEKEEYSKEKPRISMFHNFPENNSSKEQKLEEIHYNSNEDSINSKFIKNAESTEQHLSEEPFLHSLLRHAASSPEENAKNTEKPPNILSADNFKALNTYGSVHADVTTVIYNSTSVKDILLENLNGDAIHENETMLFRKNKHHIEETFMSVSTERPSIQISEHLPEGNNVTERQDTLNTTNENNVSGIIDINTDSNGKHFSVQIKQDAHSNLPIHTYTPFPGQKELNIWESVSQNTNRFNSLNVHSEDRHESEGSGSNKIFQGPKTVAASEERERKRENGDPDKLVYMSTVNESNFQFSTNIKQSEEFISDESNFRMLENDEIKSFLLLTTSAALINTDSVQEDNDDVNRKPQNSVGIVEEFEHNTMSGDATEAKSLSLTTSSEIHIPERSESNLGEPSTAQSDEYSDINKELLKKFEKEFEKLMPKIYETRADNPEISRENIFITTQSLEGSNIRNINGQEKEYKDRKSDETAKLDANLRFNGESETNDYTEKMMETGYYLAEEPNFTTFDDEMGSRISEAISSHSLNLDEIWKDNGDINRNAHITIGAKPESDMLPKYALKFKSSSLKPMIIGSENSSESMIQKLDNTDIYNTGVDNVYNVHGSDDNKRTAEINGIYKTTKEKNIDMDDAHEILMNNGNSLGDTSATDTYVRWKNSVAKSEMFMFRQKEQEKETLPEGNENDSTESEGTSVYSINRKQFHEQTEMNKIKTTSNKNDKKIHYLKQLVRNYQKKLAELLFKSHNSVTHMSNLRSLNENVSATAQRSHDSDIYHTNREEEHNARTNSDKNTAEVISALHENLSDTDVKESERYVTNDINFSTFTEDEIITRISEISSSDSADIDTERKISDAIKNITITNAIYAQAKNNSILKYGADTKRLSSLELLISSTDNSQKNTNSVGLDNIFAISYGKNNKENTRSTDVHKLAKAKTIEISKVYETSIDYEDNASLKSLTDVYDKVKDPAKYIGSAIAHVFDKQLKQEDERSLHGNVTSTSSISSNGTFDSFFTGNEFPEDFKFNTMKASKSKSDQNTYRFNELSKAYRKKTQELWSKSYENITQMETLKNSNENSISSSPKSDSSDIYPVREDMQEDRGGRSTDEESETKAILIPLNSTLHEGEKDAPNIKIKPNEQTSSDETNFSVFTSDEINSQLFVIASSYSITPETVQKETSDTNQKFPTTGEEIEREFLNRNEIGCTKYENLSVTYFSSSCLPIHLENTTVNVERSLHGNVTSTSGVNSNGTSESFFSGNDFPNHSKLSTMKASNSNSDQKSYHFNELIKTYRKKTEELWSKGYENMPRVEKLKNSNKNSISSSPKSESSDIYSVREDMQEDISGVSTDGESETKEMLIPLNSTLDEGEKDASNIKIKPNEQTSSDETNFSMFTGDQMSSPLFVIASSYSIIPETLQKEMGNIDQKFPVTGEEIEEEVLKRNEIVSTKYENPPVPYFSSSYFPIYSENTTVNVERFLHANVTSRSSINSNGTSESLFSGNEFPADPKINKIKSSDSNSDQKRSLFNELIKTYREKTEELWSNGYESMTHVENLKTSNENSISSLPKSEFSDTYRVREDTKEDRGGRSTDEESETKAVLIPLNSTLQEGEKNVSNIKIKANEQTSSDEQNFSMFTGDKMSSQLFVIASSYSITPKTLEKETGDIDQKFSITEKEIEEEFLKRNEIASTKYENPSVPYFSSSYFSIHSENTTGSASSDKSGQNNEHLRQLVKNYVINSKTLLNRNYENMNENSSHIVQAIRKQEFIEDVQNGTSNTSEQPDFDYERSLHFLRNSESKDMVKKFHTTEETSTEISDNGQYTSDQTLKYSDVDSKHQSWTAVGENSSQHSQSVSSEIIPKKTNDEYSLKRTDYTIIKKTQETDSADTGLESTLLRVREGTNSITHLGTKVFEESFKTNDDFGVKTTINSQEKISSMQTGNKIIETTERNYDNFSQERENIFMRNKSMRINNMFFSMLPDNVTKSNVSPRMQKTILMKVTNKIPVLLPENTRNDRDHQLATIWQSGRGNINTLFGNSVIIDSYANEKSVEAQGDEESSISASDYINLNDENNGITLITENTADRLNSFNVSLEIDRNITGYETPELFFRRNRDNAENSSSTVEDIIMKTFPNLFGYRSSNEETQDIITSEKDKISTEIYLGSNANKDTQELILEFHSPPLSAAPYSTELTMNPETENFTLEVEINKIGKTEMIDKAIKVQSLSKTAGFPTENSPIADLIQNRISDQNMTLTTIANILHTFENLSNAQELESYTHKSRSDIADFKVDIDSRVPNAIAETQTNRSRNPVVFQDNNNRKETNENRLFMRKTRNDMDEGREIKLISKVGISPTEIRNESTKTTVRIVKFDVAGKSGVLIKDEYSSTQDTRKQPRIGKITELHASEKSTERLNLKESPISSSADYNDLKEENDINLILENTKHPSNIFNVSLKLHNNTAGIENQEPLLRQDVNNANNASIAITHILTKAFSNLFEYESVNEEPQDISRREEDKPSTEIFQGSYTLEMKESNYSFAERPSSENFHNISEGNAKLPGFPELEIDNDIMNITFRANSDSNLTFTGNNEFFQQKIENTVVNDPNMQVNMTSSTVSASLEETSYLRDLTRDLHIMFRKKSMKDEHIVTQGTIPLILTSNSTMSSEEIKSEKESFSDSGAIVALITNNETSDQGFAFSDNDRIVTDSPSNELSDQGTILTFFKTGSMVPKIQNNEKSDKDTTTFISSDGVNIASDETNDKAINEGMTLAISDDGSITSKKMRNGTLDQDTTFAFSDYGSIISEKKLNETLDQDTTYASSDDGSVTSEKTRNDTLDQDTTFAFSDDGSITSEKARNETLGQETTFAFSDDGSITSEKTLNETLDQDTTYASSDDGSVTSEKTRNDTLDQDTTFAFSDDGNITSEKTRNGTLGQDTTFAFSDDGSIASEEMTNETSDQNTMFVLSDDNSITTEETRNGKSERGVTFTVLVSGSTSSEEKHIETSDQLTTFPMSDSSNNASEESSNKAQDQGTISTVSGGGSTASEVTSHEISDQDATFAFSDSSNIVSEITSSETLVEVTTAVSSVTSNEILDQSTTFVFWNGSSTASEVVNNGISNQSVISTGTVLNMQTSEDLVNGGKTEIYAENSGFDIKSNLHFETSVDSLVSSVALKYRNGISKHSENNVTDTSDLLFPLNNIIYQEITMSKAIDDINPHFQTSPLENANITVSEVKNTSAETEFFSSRVQEHKDIGEIFAYDTVSSGNLQQQTFVSNDSGVNVPVAENKNDVSISSYSSEISMNHPIIESVNINQNLSNENGSTEIPKTSLLIYRNPITENMLSLSQQQNFEELDQHSNDNANTSSTDDSLRTFDNDTFPKHETYVIYSSAYNATNEYSALETEMKLQEIDVQLLSSYDVNDTFTSDAIKTKFANTSNNITLRIIYSSTLNEKTVGKPDNDLTKSQHFSFEHDLLENDHLLKAWDRNHEDEEFEKADSGGTFVKDDDDEEESEEGFRYQKGPEYVIGGRYEEEPWSWMVSIYTYPKMEFVCAGSLIDDLHILSAAHCFDITKKQKYMAFIGYLRRPVEYSSYQNVENIGHKVKKLYVHENFTMECFCNDIAILKLEMPVGPEYTPVCLPELDAAVEGENTTVLGWGDTFYDPQSGAQGTEILQRVDDLTVYSKHDCYNIISNIAGFKMSKDFGEYYICAGVPNGQKDACTGDSGGPLMHEDYDGVWSLVGIISFGIKCGEPGVPGFYSRVSYYMPWILSVIGYNA